MVFGGTGVRAQVFEVIVRQAMAGAPWREICAGPMRVNNITEEEIETEVARRRNLGLKCFSKEELAIMEAYIKEWEAIVSFEKRSTHPAARLSSPDSSDLRKNVRPLVDHLYRTLGLEPPAVAICESPAKRFLYERVLATCQTSSSRPTDATIEALAAPILSDLEPDQRGTYLANFRKDLDQLFEGGFSNPGSSLSNKLFDQFFQKFGKDLKQQITQLLKVDASTFFSAGFNFRVEPIFRRLRTVFDISVENLLDADPGNGPQTGGNPIPLRAPEAALAQATAFFNSMPFLAANPLAQPSLSESTWGVWKTDLIIGGGFVQERLEQRGSFTDPCDAELRNWLAMFRAAPWYAFFENICYVGVYPENAHFDETIRMHNNTGPALTYSDGWSIWALDGIRAPRKFVETPELTTTDEIQQTDNVALRRMMIEAYGAARYLADSNSKLIHKDEFGELYQQELPGDEPLTMLCVTNSTMEPDGTYRKYYLRVPPTVRTAKEAVAWTFDMSEEQYEPDAET